MKVDDFQNRIAQAKTPLLVEFWAPWCAPCRFMAPLLDEAAAQYHGRVEVVKINADESPELLASLGIVGIPTLLGVVNGEVAYRKTGAAGAGEIRRIFDALAAGRAVEKGPAPVERMVRAGSGLLVAGLALLTWPSWLLLAVAGLLVFSAVYDRCPIYQALLPRLKAFVRGR